MMGIDECYQLGYVIKNHGLNGEVNVFLDVDLPEDYKNLESVFVEIDKKLVPFFIEQIVIKGKKAKVRFEDVDSLSAADELKGKSLYLPLENLPPLSEKQFYYHDVISYAICDQQEGEFGLVEDVITAAHQDLLVIDVKGKEVLVPINDEIIDRVDHDQKKLHVNLPEGLLDIYLKDDED